MAWDERAPSDAHSDAPLEGFEWVNGHLIRADDGSGCQPGENADAADEIFLAGAADELEREERRRHLHANAVDKAGGQVDAERRLLGEARPETQQWLKREIEALPECQRREAVARRSAADRRWKQTRQREETLRWRMRYDEVRWRRSRARALQPACVLRRRLPPGRPSGRPRAARSRRPQQASRDGPSDRSSSGDPEPPGIDSDLGRRSETSKQLGSTRRWGRLA